MGCDYYHEAMRADADGVDPSELSGEPGELEIVCRVTDEHGTRVEEKRVSVEVPVGGKVYLDRLTDQQIWAR